MSTLFRTVFNKEKSKLCPINRNNYPLEFKGSSVRKSAKDIDVKVGNVASNLSTNGDINIASGTDTNIIASNLSGTNGNIIVGKYIDQNINSPTFNQEIINKDATLTIKSGEDLHHNYHEEMKLKTDSTAVVVGAVAAGTVAFFTAGAGLVLVGAAASGAATGAQGKKGKTTTTETTEITQIKSNLNFTNDLNTQSSGNTEITASNLSANNATILTGKFRDQNTGETTIINPDAQLKINSAFDMKETKTTVERVKPNYVGIAVVSGVKTYISGELFGYDPSLPGIALTGYSLKTDKSPEEKGMFDLVVNFRDKSSSSTYKRNEVKTNLNFNNLITQ